MIRLSRELVKAKLLQALVFIALESHRLRPGTSVLKRMHILLASTSASRRALLMRLGLAFECMAPGSDETPLPHETPAALVKRLAAAKANAVAQQHPESLVIGGDQVAVLDDRILGKPSNHAGVVQQLTALSGRSATFYTGICVHHVTTGRQLLHVDVTQVHFRKLTAQEIERYLQAEP